MDMNSFFYVGWLREISVGDVPGSSFFRENINHLIRLHFAKEERTLYEALERLSQIRNKIKVHR
jgi:aspartate/methionine/tyrosine aminotransferase